MHWWYQAKLFLEHSLAVSMDALHIIAGVLIWFVAALVLRKPLTSWRPWLLLFAVLLVNEVGDITFERWPEPSMQYGEGAKDLLLTMLVPTLLLFAARRVPWLFVSP